MHPDIVAWLVRKVVEELKNETPTNSINISA